MRALHPNGEFLSDDARRPAPGDVRISPETLERRVLKLGEAPRARAVVQKLGLRPFEPDPRGGRLVLMGSAEVPLELSFREMLANDWEVVGQFMYERTAPGQLAGLAAEGLLDLGKIIVTTFALADFKRAVEAAALMQGLDLTAVVP